MTNILARLPRSGLPSPIHAMLALLAVACADTPDDVDDLELELAPAYKAQVKSGKLSIIGNSAASKLSLRLGATAATLLVDIGDDGSAEYTFDRSTFDRIAIDAGGGNDIVRMDEQAGAFTNEEQVTISGGSGDDTINGRIGVDTIVLGTGDDRVLWEPGGSSDIIEGDDGNDVLVFRTANIGE